MKYWPLSAIKESPLMPPAFAWELCRVYQTCSLTQEAFNACGSVASYTAPQDTPNLAIVQSIGAPARRVYVGHPECDEWLRLERGGVIEGDDGLLHVIIDALH